MNNYLVLLISLLVLSACMGGQVDNQSNSANWDDRIVSDLPADSMMEKGTTYLSVYSQIYSRTEHKKHNLTATVSLRNTSSSESVFLTQADYFDTHGKLIHRYVESPIQIAPMETLEVVISEEDQRGGTGANFLFNWLKMPSTTEPHFECIMVSTYGQQGLSFTTTGKRIE